ncbi:MAG: response regulator [Methanomicrobiales archaeon]|nr:response regulator [Methanomicrobiales archaeon]
MPPPPTILIACGDLIIANLASLMLQKKGYGIAGSVTNGEDALVKTAGLVPDLVVMDVSLAGPMDAIDTGHYIYQIFHIPVIFIAANTDEEKLARIKIAQPYGVVFRPFTQVQIATSADIALYVHTDRISSLGPLPLGDSRRMMDLNDEAVIILDKRGRVLLFNTFASWMLDLPLSKTFLRHWRDVMMFTSDATGEEVSDPVTGATRNMAGAIYDASISLVTTTSKRRKVTLAVRPIGDNRERLIGSMMSIKENKKTYL